MSTSLRGRLARENAQWCVLQCGFWSSCLVSTIHSDFQRFQHRGSPPPSEKSWASGSTEMIWNQPSNCQCRTVEQQNTVLWKLTQRITSELGYGYLLTAIQKPLQNNWQVFILDHQDSKPRPAASSPQTYRKHILGSIMLRFKWKEFNIEYFFLAS